MIERYFQYRRKEGLRQTGTIMVEDYATDSDLTALTALAGEDLR